MAERRYYAYGGGAARAATFNPRSSMPLMPSSGAYSSFHGGDIHVFPVASSNRFNATPRYHSNGPAPPRAPSTTTYTVNPEFNRGSSVREGSRSRRSSTLDSSNPRPVIVTTTQNGRAHNASGSHANSRGRSISPARDEYRASDHSFYTQPASSIPSRGAPRGAPYTAALDNDEYARRGDPFAPPGRADTYRNPRPTVVYPSAPRHNAAVDLGDDAYQYTNPSELVRYDLEHPRSSRSRRRESLDRYSRPNVVYNPERSNINVTTDSSRVYNPNSASRSFDSRGGPPPTTWGLDRVNRNPAAGLYDNPPVGVPPPAPAPPNPHLDIPGSSGERRGSGRSSRPVSLYQEVPPRSTHHDEYYKSREDDRTQRELRDFERESQRQQDRDFYHDGDVTSRGFGLRTDLAQPEAEDRRERRERRTSRLEDPVKWSDDSLDRPNGRDEERDRRSSRQKFPKDSEPLSERRASKNGDENGERKRFRDKVNTGLGIAASAVGLGPLVVDKESKAGKDQKGSPVHRQGLDDNRPEDSDEIEIVSSRAADRHRARDKEASSSDRPERSEASDRLPDSDVDRRELHRRAAEARLNGNPTKQKRDSSESDEGKPRSRRRRPSNSFNPNDTQALQDVKEKLAALNVSDQAAAAAARRESSSVSPRETDTALALAQPDDARSRELVIRGQDERQVRLVSPPRDKSDSKPIRGILKNPSTKFPEDPNPVREGVAPHKKDEKLKEVPPGARWTRISRKVVNPEALTIGKERFEVRDDFVIVLRVLSMEEIQAYAAATQTLRERRAERDQNRDRDRGKDDEDRGKSHRHYRSREDDDEEEDEREHEKERDHGRHRRHRREKEEGEDSQHHRRSHRERERDRDVFYSSDE